VSIREEIKGLVEDEVVNIVKACSYDGCNVSAAEHEAEALTGKILSLVEKRDEWVSVDDDSEELIKVEVPYWMAHESICGSFEGRYNVEGFYECRESTERWGNLASRPSHFMEISYPQPPKEQ